MSKTDSLSSIRFSSKLLNLSMILETLKLAISVRSEDGLEIPKLCTIRGHLIKS